MRPVRSRGIFGPGGPLNTATAATKLAIAIVAVSVLNLLPFLRGQLFLYPAQVIEHFALWQFITYAFVAGSPFGVIFGVLIVWMIGGALESTWGPRRMLSFAVGSTLLAGIVTAALGLVWGGVRGSVYDGATVMTGALWVAFGWSLGSRPTNFWGLPLSGNALAWIGVGFVALNAAFMGSIIPVIPEALALLFAWVYVKVGTPNALVLRLRQWKLQRDLRSRTKHLRVISRERNTPSGSDRFLH